MGAVTIWTTFLEIDDGLFIIVSWMWRLDVEDHCVVFESVVVAVTVLAEPIY